MTNAIKPEPRPTNLNLDRTRQQLRELDSLLQQMLALPLDDTEPPKTAEPAPAPAVPMLAMKPPARAEEPKRPAPPSTFVSLRVYAPPDLPAPPTPAPVLETPKASELAAVEVVERPAPTATADVLPITAKPAPQWDIHGYDLSGPNQLDLSPDHSWTTLGGDEQTPSTVNGSAATPSRLRRFLLTVNRIFDWSLRLLGPVGLLLTTRGGRNFLGWTGVLLLVAAAALGLTGWLNWTR